MNNGLFLTVGHTGNIMGKEKGTSEKAEVKETALHVGIGRSEHEPVNGDKDRQFLPPFD
jgi:hypothetical protein